MKKDTCKVTAKSMVVPFVLGGLLSTAAAMLLKKATKRRSGPDSFSAGRNIDTSGPCDVPEGADICFPK